jgi:hypothetical protein
MKYRGLGGLIGLYAFSKIEKIVFCVRGKHTKTMFCLSLFVVLDTD